MAVDALAVRRAIEALLAACHLPPDEELRDTPSRVADAWCNELLDGYAHDPAVVLRDGVRATDPGFVSVGPVRFATMCPHHLMPGLGRAWLGYFPGERVAGLGTLVKLLEIHAHRLVLQETLGQRVADSLVEHLGAKGAGVMLRGRHMCLSARGEKQQDALVTTVAFAGSLTHDASAREVFLSSLPRAARRARG